GPVTISGVGQADQDVVRREVAFKEGAPFQQSLLEKTRKNIDALHLFRSVRLVEDDSRDEAVAVDIKLAEAERHEVKLGVGYDTEEGIRGIAGWRGYASPGGAGQPVVPPRAPQPYRPTAGASPQPHFPSQTSRVRLIFLQEQTVETTYNLLETKLLPRLEWDVTPRLTTYAFYRASLNLLSNVKPAIRLALSGPNQDQSRPSRAVISGLGFGVDWNGTDDLVNPTRGEIGRFSVEPVGVGGDVHFLRLIGEGRLYVPLLEQFGAAGRLRLRSEEPID